MGVFVPLLKFVLCFPFHYWSFACCWVLFLILFVLLLVSCFCYFLCEVVCVFSVVASVVTSEVWSLKLLVYSLLLVLLLFSVSAEIATVVAPAKLLLNSWLCDSLCLFCCCCCFYRSCLCFWFSIETVSVSAISTEAVSASAVSIESVSLIFTEAASASDVSTEAVSAAPFPAASAETGLAFWKQGSEWASGVGREAFWIVVKFGFFPPLFLRCLFYFIFLYHIFSSSESFTGWAVLLVVRVFVCLFVLIIVIVLWKWHLGLVAEVREFFVYMGDFLFVYYLFH